VIMSVRTKHLSGMVVRERSAPGPGPALWSPAGPDGDRHYLWPGRGAGLFVVDGDGIAAVTHAAASGQYGELKQARGAVARLLAGLAPHGIRPAGRRGSCAERPPCTDGHARGPQAAGQRACGQPGQLPSAPLRTS
jgi:hypothetical protein